MDYDLILGRYGEIALKSPQVRRRFESQLIHNIKSAFKTEVHVKGGRIFIYPADFEEALNRLAKIFGIVSFSPAIAMKTDKKVISTKLQEYVEKLNLEGLFDDKKSFAIRCKRTGTHDFTSQELAAYAGSIVTDKIGAPVNLTKPDIEIFLDVRGRKTYLFHEILPGPGGLPIGISGKVISLLSGGIDSAVATYLVMKRGCKIVALHFDTYPYTGKKNKIKIKKLVDKLKEYSQGVKFELLTVEYGEYLDYCMLEAPRNLTCILCKFGMYHIAEKIAKKIGALAIVDGNSIGQVASQTLYNILATRYNVKIPILSPLIGFDKVEIENLAKRIGTYEISILPNGKCTAAPTHPMTKIEPERLLKIKESLDLDLKLEEIMDKIRY
ncbi:MAG TPA: tRNA 4-thiouridine(8) synthase ThiI [Methanobacteriales archaeon]|nr:tRNA 4-thiouridine(8) synthase ThiI [Methanobacteriaceae archaeon]HIH61524.1 tRNA 4-thiouridine(8) synthase ThiI [Methanobacteriales archaeon]